MRSTRQGSVCTQSEVPRRSSSRWSVVEPGIWLRRNVIGPRRLSGGCPPGSAAGSTVWSLMSLACLQVAAQHVFAARDEVEVDRLLARVREVRVTGAVVDRRDAQLGEPRDV